MVLAPVISYSECLSDSPRFRSQLQGHESNLDDLEARLDKTLRLSAAMADGGKAHVTQMTHFLASLWELSAYFAASDDHAVLGQLNRLIHAMQEIIKLQNGLVDALGKVLFFALKPFDSCQTDVIYRACLGAWAGSSARTSRP